MPKQTLNEFLSSSSKCLEAFYANNPTAEKLPHLDLNSSAVQERIMRLGVEARYFGVSSEESLYLLALATLQNDHVKYEAERLKRMEKWKDICKKLSK